MSTNVESINYATGAVLDGLTAPGGLSYVWAWDTSNNYVRFFDGTTAGGRRMAFYSDLTGGSAQAANLVYAGPAGGSATAPTFRQLTTADLPAAIIGALEYQGIWNASTNTPTLMSSIGTKGFYYKVAVAGTTPLNGISTWNLGDVAVFDGTSWDKIDGTASEVLSFNGRTGTVALAASDVTAVLGFAPLNPANNLSDIANAAAALGNLGAAALVSPAFSGAPTAPTPGSGDNSTRIATTAYVQAALPGVPVPAAGTTPPIMDGAAAAGTSSNYARADHVHPSDNSRLAAANNLSDVGSPATARRNLSPTRVVSGALTLTASDYTIFADASAGAASLTLPASPAPGQEIRVKDHKGASYANPITVLGSAGATIDGQSSFLMNVNFRADSFVWNGTQWSVMT